MVLHYLVRMEPFTSLHIELQSGRFDVADRQFNSIPQTWKSLLDNLNDVKELIPEFFYFPEFLVNMNNFDLGKLQGGKKAIVGDVILPKWASNPDDFIRKHSLALESDYVSENLHHWIDLIFGYKQKGPEAVKALNVFYYCTYEGAVNLDAIEDLEEREAVEGMINNFGQTPCRLIKDPHPKRLSLEESLSLQGKNSKKRPPDLLASMPDWKPYMLDLVASTDKDPIVFIHAPGWKRQNQHFIGPISGLNETIVTISSSGIIGVHGWTPFDTRASGNDFCFEIDAAFATTASQRPPQRLPTTFAPGLQLTAKLFVASQDGKHVVSGGHWDNSLRVFSLLKGRHVASVVRHIDVVTCVAASGHYIMSGSKDTTSIVWDVAASMTTPKPVQILAGHDLAVQCVALAAELDMAVSGSEDGTVNVYTIKEGQFMRSLRPPMTEPDFVVAKLALSFQGHVVLSGHSRDVHSIHVYTVNGRILQSNIVLHRTTCLLVADREHVIVGDENGELSVRDLFSGEVIHSLPLQLPIQSTCLVSRNSHLMVPLRDGRLIVIGSVLKKVR
jgi:WD40 repeat protein